MKLSALLCKPSMERTPTSQVTAEGRAQSGPEQFAAVPGYPLHSRELDDASDRESERAERSGRSLRFAYADPPYYGLAAKFYGHLHAEAADYDKLETHAALIAKLCAEYDGWAMSLHAPVLRDILNLCPREARVMPWVKSFASFKPSAKSAQWAWEPVIVWGGRPLEAPHCIRDWISCRMAMEKGFRGAKPRELVQWVLQVLGARKTDVIDDLFPGSGEVTREIQRWREERDFFPTGGGGAERQGEMTWTAEKEANDELSDSHAKNK